MQADHTKIVKVYDYYDQPILFLCKDDRGVDATLGQLYIALLVDSHESCDIFFYLAVSPSRLEKLETGKLELRTGFELAEWGFVYQVNIFFNGQTPAVAKVSCVDLNPDDLPEAGTYLNSNR